MQQSRAKAHTSAWIEASLGFLLGAFLTSSAPPGRTIEGIFETGELDVDFFSPSEPHKPNTYRSDGAAAAAAAKAGAGGRET